MTFSLAMSELLQGFGTTLLLFVITLLIALPLGLLLAFGSMSKIKPIKYIVKAFIWVIRGTPLLLQILLISFLPMLFGVLAKDFASFLGLGINALMFVFVAVAFCINYACYFSEIFRAGIESIPRGQYEAGQVLGMTKKQIFYKIILMQVIKHIIPPMSNEIITLVKDTALAQILGVVDLFVATKHLVNTYAVLTPFLYAGVFYLLFNGLLTIIFSQIEKRLSYYKV